MVCTFDQDIRWIVLLNFTEMSFWRNVLNVASKQKRFYLNLTSYQNSFRKYAKFQFLKLPTCSHYWQHYSKWNSFFTLLRSLPFVRYAGKRTDGIPEEYYWLIVLENIIELCQLEVSDWNLPVNGAKVQTVDDLVVECYMMSVWIGKIHYQKTIFA